MMEKRRLVYCNGKYHVILPSKWVKSVGVQDGDEVTLEIDKEDYHKLIIKLIKK
jgi:antitoxin component of MazEF toxin-antitoxin module